METKEVRSPVPVEMSLQCCFKFCKKDRLTQESARAEIKSAIPKSGLKRHEASLLVNWRQNGEAVFHPDCWSFLLNLSRKRTRVNRKRKANSNSPDAGENLKMVQSEKVMIKEASKTMEKFDSVEDIVKSSLRIVDMIKESKYCVFFTGAGISTSAGLGDFRGKGGKWTEQDREAIDVDSLFKDTVETKSGGSGTNSSVEVIENEVPFEKKSEEKDEPEDIQYEELRPTLTHEVISKLIQLGHVKYLISQNCDGLHLLSGVPAHQISELHGNVFVEKCEKCDRRYERSHYVCDDISDLYLEELSDFGKTDIIAPKYMKKCKTCGLSHRTGRRCDNKSCNGYLLDTIINFRDLLEDSILDRAYEAADKCDLMICLGTTLTVTPANELVDYVKNPRRIVICNRQPTEKDEACQEKDEHGETLGVRVYGDCDIFMRHLISNLLGVKGYHNFETDLKTKLKYYNSVRQSSSQV